jgi:hypothetical protein
MRLPIPLEAISLTTQTDTADVVDDVTDVDDLDLDGDGADVDEPTDEELRAQGIKALRDERRQRRALEGKVTALEKKLARQKPAKPADPAVDVDELTETLTETITAKVTAEYGAKLLRAEAIAELQAARVHGDPELAVRLLDLEDVDFSDEAGRREDIRDLVAALKEKNPGWFRGRQSSATDDDREARRPAGSADIGRKRSKPADMDPLEAAARAMLGISPG